MHVVSAPHAGRVRDHAFGTVHVAEEAAASTVHVVTTVTLDETHIARQDYPAFRAFCEAGDHALGQRLVVSR